MQRKKLGLFVHIIWGTWDRLPSIIPSIERQIYREIEHEAQKLGCVVIALNGYYDHVHALLSFPTTVALATVIQQMKGVSSRFVNEVLKPNDLFRWQGRYGAFTVSPWEVEEVKQYILRQKEHHNENTLLPILEEIPEER